MKYKSMTKSELKQYLLNNRNDKEALKELKSRPKQNVITIPANINTEEQDYREPIFRNKLGEPE